MKAKITRQGCPVAGRLNWRPRLSEVVWSPPCNSDKLLLNQLAGGGPAMLAEKFFLVLETLRSFVSDGSVKVVSTTPHVPVKVPPQK